MKTGIRGTGTALVTPFDKDKRFDLEALARVIEHNIKDGVDFLVSMGTTGESATLDKKEIETILQFTAEVVDRRVALVAGIGGNNTNAVAAQLRSFNIPGYSAILSVSPYYNKPTQEGIRAHYLALADVTPLPIILYNVPGRTSSNLTAETTLRLSAHEMIMGVKEASGDFEQCMVVLKDRPEDFLVLSGDDILTLPLISCGGDGVVSVVSNAFPGIFSEMVRKALEGRIEEARELHYRLSSLIPLLFRDGNPAGVKTALELIHLCESHVRLPLTPVSTETRNSIAREVERINSKQSVEL